MNTKLNNSPSPDASYSDRWSVFIDGNFHVHDASADGLKRGGV
jgi:hypothetical protein